MVVMVEDWRFRKKNNELVQSHRISNVNEEIRKRLRLCMGEKRSFNVQRFKM